MTLLEAFSSVKDPRRKQGMRITLPQVLTITFLAYLCGYTSYRQLARFGASCQALLEKELGLKHGIPSHVTFRDILQRLDEKSCIAAFNSWATAYTQDVEDTEISGDGKSLRSTVSGSHNSSQDFKAVVSLFGQSSGLVYQVNSYRSKKNSEIECLQHLINGLKNKGLTICADALHAQKKR